MMLKIVCQKCGRVEIENTSTTSSSGWRFSTTVNLLRGINKCYDWEVWFCPECWQRYRDLLEHDPEAAEDMMLEIFQPVPDEEEVDYDVGPK